MKQLILVLVAYATVTATVSGPLNAQQVFNWAKETGEAPWQPRDSQGEVVFRDKLWIFGGWFNSFAAPPRDVWSSADGKTWKLVQQTAPWKHSDLSMSVPFAGRYASRYTDRS